MTTDPNTGNGAVSTGVEVAEDSRLSTGGTGAVAPRPTGKDTAPPEAKGMTPPANGDARRDGNDDGNERDAATGNGADLRGAPDAYQDFSMPDGIDVQADMIESFQNLAKELDLSQDGAQRLVDLQVALTREAMEQRHAQWADLQAEWVEQVQTDREIGGDRLDESVAVARAALERFGTPALKQALDEYGLGNHPELVRTFYRIGKAVSPDAVFSRASGPGAPTNKTVAERVYPEQGRG